MSIEKLEDICYIKMEKPAAHKNLPPLFKNKSRKTDFVCV